MRIVGLTVTFDARDVEAESAFWAAVLDGEVVPYDNVYREIRVSDGSCPVGVQLSDELAPHRWPEEPARAHLDLVVEDVGEAEREVLDLGAEVLQRSPGGQTFNVYTSPSGHPFCLCWQE